MHYWGHGPGHEDGKYWKCGNSSCRKVLPYLTLEQRATAKKKLDEYVADEKMQMQIAEAMEWAEQLAAGELIEEDM